MRQLTKVGRGCRERDSVPEQACQGRTNIILKTSQFKTFCPTQGCTIPGSNPACGPSLGLQTLLNALNRGEFSWLNRAIN